MRALKALVIAMGVLIVGATAAMIVLIVLKATAPSPHRGSESAPAPPATPSAPPRAAPGPILNEPAGSRILAMARVPNGLALALSGGGEADRIVIIDPTTGHVVERIGLSQ